MKKTLFVLAIIAATLCGLIVWNKGKVLPPAPQATQPIVVAIPEPPKVFTFEDAVKAVDKADATKWLGYLASNELEGRMSGKNGNKLAAEFCKKKFEEFGYKTEYQRFSIRRVNSGPKNEMGDDFTNNIIAVKKGETDRVIVIAAHMDHVGYGPNMSTDGRVGIHPGADDNASGTTGVLLTAKAMSKLPPLKHTIVFILFSGEEMGLIGSKYYVSQLDRSQLSKIDLMINYDMIGRLKPSGLVECVGARKSRVVTDLLMKLEPKYPPLKLAPKTGDGEGNSDHAPFYDRGVTVCFFFTGMHPQYHKVSDTADLINYDGLVTVTKLGMNLAYDFDKETK